MRLELERLDSLSLRRSLSAVRLLPGGWLEKDGRRMLNLASNDYLGIASEGGYVTEEADALQTGAGASRLVVGGTEELARFEEAYAAYHGVGAALVYGSGYAANVGVLGALLTRDDAVFSDRLNHASIVDGIVLSRAEHFRYRHLDMNQLEAMLKKVSEAAPRRKKLIVTDAVFSMDGDAAPLMDIIALKERYGALLMIDEAHSGGVCGKEGRGLADALGAAEHIDIHMGTFSKAYGALGGYIAGDTVLKEYLVNRSRSFIYTTGLPPVVIAAIERNWRKVRAADEARDRLRRNAALFREGLAAAGFQLGDSASQIVPLLAGESERAVRMAARLQQAGIAAVAIRPPTVPEGTARIRFSLMAQHEPEALLQAVQVITDAGKQEGIV
nr:8-amino-7-oxononanoate synthase [Paenibacillus turpanensis]